ncbi:MAG: hypothetical protein LIO77_08730 [Rikenellaceae bacterium]|nr:hypothetical protein [Rikenellaceae bacterium]
MKTTLISLFILICAIGDGYPQKVTNKFTASNITFQRDQQAGVEKRFSGSVILSFDDNICEIEILEGDKSVLKRSEENENVITAKLEDGKTVFGFIDAGGSYVECHDDILFVSEAGGRNMYKLRGLSGYDYEGLLDIFTGHGQKIYRRAKPVYDAYLKFADKDFRNYTSQDDKNKAIFEELLEKARYKNVNELEEAIKRACQYGIADASFLSAEFLLDFFSLMVRMSKGEDGYGDQLSSDSGRNLYNKMIFHYERAAAFGNPQAEARMREVKNLFTRNSKVTPARMVPDGYGPEKKQQHHFFLAELGDIEPTGNTTGRKAAIMKTNIILRFFDVGHDYALLWDTYNNGFADPDGIGLWEYNYQTLLNSPERVAYYYSLSRIPDYFIPWGSDDHEYVEKWSELYRIAYDDDLYEKLWAHKNLTLELDENRVPVKMIYDDGNFIYNFSLTVLE